MNTSKHRQYEIGDWRNDTLKSWWAWVYVGGDIKTAEMVCRELCFPKGLCVTIEPLKYIFAGGTEEGYRIGLIQYPPFPGDEDKLKDKAVMVGKAVARANYQWSFSIVMPDEVLFCSRRANE